MRDETDLYFARKLRERRDAAGLSLAGLSRLVHYSKSYLSKVENGLKMPSVDFARRCDAQLGADGELAALVVSPSRPAVPPAAESAALWTMGLSPDGRSEFAGARLHGPHHLGVASFSWTLRPAKPPQHTDGATIPAFQQLFVEMRRLGQSLTPAAMLPMLVAQTNALRVMAPQAAKVDRNRILLLAAPNAEFAGWMAQEAGNDEAAMWWTDQSCELAEAAEFPDFAAYALVRQGLITMYRQDSRNTVLLATMAQDQTGNPRIAGLAAQREAQGHALANDHDACLRALDRARELLNTAVPSDSPVIGRTSTITDPVPMATAWCLHDLGRPREAAEMFAREIPRIPAEAHRAGARFTARYALSLAASGEVEQACLVAEPILATLERIDSATIVTDLRRLAQELGRAYRNSTVRAFLPKLANTLLDASVAPSGAQIRAKS